MQVTPFHDVQAPKRGIGCRGIQESSGVYNYIVITITHQKVRAREDLRDVTDPTKEIETGKFSHGWGYRDTRYSINISMGCAGLVCGSDFKGNGVREPGGVNMG